MEKAFFVETVAGIFMLNEDGEVIRSRAFTGMAEAIRELGSISDGRLGEISLEIVGAETQSEAIFEDPRLAADARTRLGIKASAQMPSEPASKLRSNIVKYMETIGLRKEEYEKTRRELALELVTSRISEVSSTLDRSIVQAVGLLDEIDKCVNLLVSRLREWYGLHFPELWGRVQRNDRYLQMVTRLGSRMQFTLQNLEKMGIPDRRAKEIWKTAEGSAGAPLEESLPHIRSFAETIVLVEKLRDRIAKFLEEAMEREAPNMRALVGASIGARLIAQAGGLQNLAKMPSSKIQVLGAEKALFRSLKTGSRPPKHGTIFQHASIHGSPRRLRGKASRVLAGKIAIAARIDAFSGGFLGDKLSLEFEKRMKRLTGELER